MNQNINQGQVPDHRLNEIMEEMRRLRDENLQFRNTLNHLYQRNTPPPQEKDESPFEPNTQQALDKYIQKKFEPIVQQQRNQVGALVDENDLLKFQQRYGVETYDKYNNKIEQIRQDAIRQNRWVSREEAYKLAYFEETSKKPQQKPEPPLAQGPKYDPYTGMMITESAQQTAPQAPPVQTQNQQAAPQPGQQMQPGQQVQQQVQQAPQNAEINLPPDVMSPGANTQAAQPAKIEFGMADDKGLSAFESKYGDVPL